MRLTRFQNGVYKYIQFNIHIFLTRHIHICDAKPPYLGARNHLGFEMVVIVIFYDLRKNRESAKNRRFSHTGSTHRWPNICTLGSYHYIYIYIYI